MDTHILKIQLFFRNIILQKRIKELRKLNLHKCETKTYEEFQNYIFENGNKIIPLFDKIIKILHINTLKPKQLISSFIIKNFSTEIFTNLKKDKLQNALYSHTVILHKYLYNDILIPNIQTLEYLLTVYYILFIYWLKSDKSELLITVYNMYYERIDKFELSSNDNISEEMFYEVQIESLNYILQISGENGLIGLSKYEPTYKKLRAEKFKKVRNIMEKAFWDKLRSDLDEEPPKFEMVVIVLTDIKSQLISLVKKNKKETEQLNDILDIEFIQKRIMNGTFDNKLLNTLIFFIIDKIKEYGAPVNDKSVDIWKNKVKDTLETSQDLTYGKLIPPLFEEMMNRIMHIHGAVKFIKEQNSNKK